MQLSEYSKHLRLFRPIVIDVIKKRLLFIGIVLFPWIKLPIYTYLLFRYSSAWSHDLCPSGLFVTETQSEFTYIERSTQ